MWADVETGVALAHRRLSIVDLSPAGHQPMTSSDGRYVISYNGEVYNYQEVRSELEAKGVRFRGHSDTEVMIEAFSAYGITTTIKRLIGMFSRFHRPGGDRLRRHVQLERRARQLERDLERDLEPPGRAAPSHRHPSGGAAGR
jgi:hypothetical protein